MDPRSLSTVFLCILYNWPFCSAEIETGTVAPVEATQVWAEGKVLPSHSPITCPSRTLAFPATTWQSWTVPLCNAILQNYCLSLHHFTSQKSHWDQVLPYHPFVHWGSGQNSFKSCCSHGVGSSHQSFLNPEISCSLLSHCLVGKLGHLWGNCRWVSF